MARRAGFIHEARASGEPILLVDAGDFSGDLDELAGIRTRFLVTGMGALGQTALNLGEKDLARGADYVRRLADSCRVPLVSANVTEAATGKLVGRPYVVVIVGGRQVGPWRAGGYRVGIFGVLDRELGAMLPPEVRSAVEIGDPLETAREIVRQLRMEERCRLVIALSHLGVTGSRELARSVPGIDLVVSGHGGSRLPEPERYGETFLVQANDLGAEVGEIDYNLGPEGPPVVESSRLVQLGSEVAGDSAGMRLLDEYAKAYRRVLEDPQEMPRDLLQAEKAFAGVDACAPCHRAIVESWRRTAHARAFADLAKTGDDVNPDCVRCHTTGFAMANGFRHRKWTPAMTDVQCETCHGPAAAHVARASGGASPVAGEDAGRAFRFEPIGARTCQGCHRGANDPDFDYGRDLQLIAHREGAAPVDEGAGGR